MSNLNPNLLIVGKMRPCSACAIEYNKVPDHEEVYFNCPCCEKLIVIGARGKHLGEIIRLNCYHCHSGTFAVQCGEDQESLAEQD